MILKVSLQKIAVLVARDPGVKSDSHESSHVIQLTSSALVMFQSIEDQDGSGSKIFHVSLKDYTASINPQFKPISLSRSSPILGPFAMEFRSVNYTENSGVVINREISVSCDTIESSLFFHDVTLMLEVIKEHQNELKKLRFDSNETSMTKSNFVASQGKGSSIATTLKFQMQPFSIVLMRTKIDVKTGICPFFEIRGEGYGKLEGCAHALFGESRADITMCFFNPESKAWEDVVEPFNIVIDFEQQPSDFVSNIVMII